MLISINFYTNVVLFTKCVECINITANETSSGKNEQKTNERIAQIPQRNGRSQKISWLIGQTLPLYLYDNHENQSKATFGSNIFVVFIYIYIYRCLSFHLSCTIWAILIRRPRPQLRPIWVRPSC